MGTEGCKYLSLGEYSEKYAGMCMGCTADATGADEDGFTFFEMEIFAPTAAPTEEDDRFNVIGQDTKCPYNKTTRLFKEEDKVHTREECYDLCYKTEGCKYFSLGEYSEKYAGMCMGCTADATGADEDGFTFFEMEIYAPTAAPTENPFDGLYEVKAKNKKCASGDRLFKTPSLTRNECYQKCDDHPECETFTLGETRHHGLCIG